MPKLPHTATSSAVSHIRRKRVKPKGEAAKAKALKTHELDSSPKAKYRRLKRLVRSLVYENGALCDETARAQRLVLQAQEERRFLLQKLIQLEDQSEAGPTPAPLAAGSGTRPLLPASAVLASSSTGAPVVISRSNIVPLGNVTTVTSRGRPSGPVGTLASHGGAVRMVPPLAAAAGTNTGRVPASLVPAPERGAVRPALSAVAPTLAVGGAAIRSTAVPLAVALASGSVGVPAPLAVVTGTTAARLPAPLVVTAATDAARLTSPLVVAAGVGATRLTAPLVVAGGTTHPPVLDAQTGAASEPLSMATSTTPSHSGSHQYRSAGALPSPRTSASRGRRRRASRTQRRVVPATPGDVSGSVRLPLRLGTLTLQTAGHIVPDRPAYHSASALYPVGYTALRRFISVVSPRRQCVYHCAIEDGGTHPRFSITAMDVPSRVEDEISSKSRADSCEPSKDSGGPGPSTPSPTSSSGVTFVGPTADACHRQLLQRLSGVLGRPLPLCCRVAGDSFFGLTHPGVQQLLQRSAGATLCGRYKPRLLECTDGEVTVQAETEPGVNATALWESLDEEV